MPTAASPRESLVPVEGARLFARAVGQGPPILVLHGGPEFDHNYLLPELDRLSASFRLVYYDQRGRGRSADGVEPGDVDIRSEVADLNAVREAFGLETTAVLGHSWGCVLALEYAVRCPERVSQLILLNTAPISYEDVGLLREHLRAKRPAADVEAMASLSATSRYLSGDLSADAEYLRIHFRAALPRGELVDEVVARLQATFTPETVVKARAIDQRLMDETWRRPEYDLRPALRELDIPTLVLHGADDFIPVEVAASVAAAIPGSRLTVLDDCGHFSYLERPDEVYRRVAEFVRS